MDNEVISDSILPPLLEFDVIYYYAMAAPDDQSGALGEIRSSNILKVDVKDMNSSKTE